MKQVCIGRDGQMLVICPALPTYSCGDCPSADNSLCLSLWPWAKRKTWTVGCLNAFPLVAPKPHSRQPSLSALLLGVATREVSQAGESARTLSGRYLLGFLLVNPLPCHSLRLVPRVWDGRKGQHQRRSRRPWGNWRNLKKQDEWTSLRGGTKLLQKWIGEKAIVIKCTCKGLWYQEKVWRGTKEKQGRQSPKGIGASGWSGKLCLTPFRRTNGGDCLIADNSLYLPRRTCYDARNTECCMPGCFSTIRLYPHDRLPSLRPSERSDIGRS